MFGMVERNGERKGRVVAKALPNAKRATIMPHVKEKVLPEAMVYTDEYRVYDSLNRDGFKHDRVHHAEEIYVAGDVHTNTVEGFWSLLKRGSVGSTIRYRPSTCKATLPGTPSATTTGKTPAGCSTLFLAALRRSILLPRSLL
ncbi:MAG: transposase [Rubrobacter sp.]|nr:transposase [Rubrobacter sp.]